MTDSFESSSNRFDLIPMQRDVHDRYRDAEGNVYYEITSGRHPEEQYVCAKLIGDFLPACPVVCGEEYENGKRVRGQSLRYFSAYLPVNDDSPSPWKSEQEVQSEIAILGEIFNSRDRHLGHPMHPQTAFFAQHPDWVRHNLICNESKQGMKVAYFDFEQFYKYLAHGSDVWVEASRDPEKYRKLVELKRDKRLTDLVSHFGIGFLGVLTERLDNLSSFLTRARVAESVKGTHYEQKTDDLHLSFQVSIRALKEAIATFERDEWDVSSR